MYTYAHTYIYTYIRTFKTTYTMCINLDPYPAALHNT